MCFFSPSIYRAGRADVQVPKPNNEQRGRELLTAVRISCIYLFCFKDSLLLHLFFFKNGVRLNTAY
jgi:hypothetical protein